VERTTQGWWNGLVGVLIFSGSLPATRLAVVDFDPLFLTGARAVLAGLLAAALLIAGQQQRPEREDLLPLVLVGLGCVVGFPLLTAWALTHITSAQAMVFIGALPLSTALFAVLRGGARPRPAFWLFSVLGCALVGAYALVQGGAGSLVGDLMMLAAIAVCGLGYAEGARLTPRLGGWQVISWSLVISLPLTLPLAWATLPMTFAGVRPSAWAGLAYVSVFSMLVGFIFWYRGLAQGGVAAVAQLQLIQPFLGMMLAALLLSEQVTWPMALSALAVIGCVAGARKFSR